MLDRKPLSYASASTHLWVLFFVATSLLRAEPAGIALRGDTPCFDLNLASLSPTTYEKLAETRKLQTFVAVGQLSGLKEITTLTNDGGVSGEFIGQAFQFFLQWHLQNQFANLGSTKISGIQVPFVKFIRIDFTSVHGSESASVAKALLWVVLERTQDSMVELLTTANSNAERMLSEYAQSPSSIPGFAPVFAEGNRQVNTYNTKTLSTLREMLRQAYGSSAETRIRNLYSLGVAKLDTDAYLHARLNDLAASAGRSLEDFNPRSLGNILSSIHKKRENLKWLFDGKSLEELTEIFTLYRKNSSANSTTELSQGLINLLKSNPGYQQSPNSFTLARTFLSFADYCRELNLIDYLPEEAWIYDLNARKRFADLENPTGIALLDIVGVGARNLAVMHQSTDGMRKSVEFLMEQVAILNTLEAANKPASQIETAKTKALQALDELESLRRSILLGTDAFIRDVRQKVIDLLLAKGLSREQFVLWASGDDIYLVINHPTISIDNAVLDIKRLPELSTSIRAAFALIPRNTSHVNLDQARATVGQAADLLKATEDLHLPYPIIAQVNFQQPSEQTLFRLTPDSIVPFANQYVLGKLGS